MPTSDEEFVGEGITIPRPNDVCKNVGGYDVKSKGLELYCKLVKERSADHPLRVDIVALSIICDIQNQNPPGQFLEFNHSTKKWNVIGKEKLKCKVMWDLKSARTKVAIFSTANKKRICRAKKSVSINNEIETIHTQPTQYSNHPPNSSRYPSAQQSTTTPHASRNPTPVYSKSNAALTEPSKTNKTNKGGGRDVYRNLSGVEPFSCVADAEAFMKRYFGRNKFLMLQSSSKSAKLKYKRFKCKDYNLTVRLKETETGKWVIQQHKTLNGGQRISPGKERKDKKTIDRIGKSASSASRVVVRPIGTTSEGEQDEGLANASYCRGTTVPPPLIETKLTVDASAAKKKAETLNEIVASGEQDNQMWWTTERGIYDDDSLTYPSTAVEI